MLLLAISSFNPDGTAQMNVQFLATCSLLMTFAELADLLQNTPWMSGHRIQQLTIVINLFEMLSPTVVGFRIRLDFIAESKAQSPCGIASFNRDFL